MIYEIKLMSLEADNFKRVYQIDAEATFLDFKNLLLKSCDYLDNAVTCFVLCDEEWNRKEEIWQENIEDEDLELEFDFDVERYTMEETKLSHVIEEEGQRLEFVFDVLNDRCFELIVTEVIPGKYLSPGLCTLKQGNPPEQIKEKGLNLDFTKSTPKGKQTNLDDFEDYSFNEDEGFNDDELDLEGFEIEE